MPKKSASAGYGYKALADALDCGYRHSNAETYRWMLSLAFDIMGLSVKEAESIPDTARSKVENALHVYEDLVSREEPWTDILGPVYMDLGSRWGKQTLGQFFTPQSIATMMSMMSVFGMEEAPDNKVIRACDPACGSGVMMLSLAQAVLKQGGPEALKRHSFTGVDLDPICARTMALQFMANCAIHQIEVGELVVLHGNSLLPWENMDVVVHATSPSFPRNEAAPALHPARLEAISQAARHAPDLQYSLFEEDAA